MQLFQRSVYCGHVDKGFLNKDIFLSGWVRTRRDHGGLIFIDLEDRTGLMQLVFNPDINKEALKLAHTLRNEFVISVKGKVINRSNEAINKNIPTGEFELQVETLSIVNKAKALPFQIDEKVDEELRLKYRYLDLRRKKMRDALKLRNDVIFSIREYLQKEGFYEIETPILSKSTPEGARDFLVPSRMTPGTFYALPQSPQIYKQLLMAGSLDKYFQIARCFRDEDLRANRQPEFTQMDLEMSFVNEKDVQNVCEGILKNIFEKIVKQPLSAIPTFTYEESFSKFGTDAPDLRFGLEIIDASSLFANTDLKFLKTVLENKGKIGLLRVENKTFTRSELDGIVDTAIKKFNSRGLLYVRFNEDGSCDSPVSKFLPEDFMQQARSIVPGLSEKDTLFFVAGKYKDAWTVLGKLRLFLGKDLTGKSVTDKSVIDKDKFAFAWVIKFPLFESKDGNWHSVHHPFTQPEEGWSSMELKDVLSRSYDIVCNGQELGGGSIRIYDSITQMKIFDILKISKQEQESFAFLLEAQNLGFPPHGGIALGLDRLIMILANTESIRDVIAFPKTQSGTCPMMQTPSSVEESQLKDLYIESTYEQEE